MTPKRVHCLNCDAVIEVPEQKLYISWKWYYFCRCYHCNSVNTEKTEEPYRSPKWEREKSKILST